MCCFLLGFENSDLSAVAVSVFVILIFSPGTGPFLPDERNAITTVFEHFQKYKPKQFSFRADQTGSHPCAMGRRIFCFTSGLKAFCNETTNLNLG